MNIIKNSYKNHPILTKEMTSNVYYQHSFYKYLTATSKIYKNIKKTNIKYLILKNIIKWQIKLRKKRQDRNINQYVIKYNKTNNSYNNIIN